LENIDILKAEILSSSEPEVILESQKSSFEKDYDGYLALVGNCSIQGNQIILNDIPGKLTIIYDFYQRYKELFYLDLLDFYKSEGLISNDSSVGSLIQFIKENESPILKQFFNIKKEKEKFWYDLKNGSNGAPGYGQFLTEGYYENSIENSSFNLYKQALDSIKFHSHPSEDYSLTYIDSSQIIGSPINLIGVGDLIQVNSKKLGILKNENNLVEVTQINRELRDDSNIQLTVDQIRKNTSFIEKLLDSIKNK
jgi:hypothetical protein